MEEGEGRGRFVLAALLLVALGTLVAVRVFGGDEPDETGAAPARAAASTTTTVAIAATGSAEPFLADPPPTVTDAELDGIHFTDVTADAGLDRPHDRNIQKADDDRSGFSSGAAVADVDGDGDGDLYVTRLGLPSSLYRNDGDGTFTDIAVEAGVARAPERGNLDGSSAAAFGDVDGDGCLDLYVASAATDGPSLFVNDCEGHFVDEADDRGLSLPPVDEAFGAHGHGATFADFDHDGDLDLLALHWDTALKSGTRGVAAMTAQPDPLSTCDVTGAARRGGWDRNPKMPANRSRLYRNDGTGHFTDATAAVGLPLDRIAAFTGDFVDVDGDGWEDLLVAGDFCTSGLFLNEGGTRFREVTTEAGLGTDENAMGSVVRDVDGDGSPDWFVTSIGGRTKSGSCPTAASQSGCSGNRLYLNRGDGTFRDATDDYGVRYGWWGWGAAIEDFGNDGRLSFAQTNGTIGQGSPMDAFTTDPMRLWVATASGRLPLEEAATKAGLASTEIGHALVPFDADGDGDLDLFVANYNSPPNLYRNDAPRGRHHVTVRLDDPSRPGNRAGLGARVRVRAGDRSVTGWITTGGSYESQKLPELHVGLGDDDRPVTVEVWWPGEAQPQTVPAVPIDRVVTIERS